MVHRYTMGSRSAGEVAMTARKAEIKWWVITRRCRQAGG